MSRFTQVWQQLNNKDVVKAVGLPYNALVKIGNIQYRVGNYDSVHDEYSLVTVENGKTVIRKFPAAQVEANKTTKANTEENEFNHVFQDEDDVRENEHNLEEAKKSSRVYGENRFTEDEAFGDLKGLVNDNEGHVLQAYVDYDDDKGQYYACVTLGDKAIVKSYKVGDHVMHKGRKYEVTAVRKDGKYTLKPTADSKGKDGTWIEEKEIHGYAIKGADARNYFIYETNEGKGPVYWVKVAGVGEEGPFLRWDTAQRWINDQVIKSTTTEEKDISPYGQAYNAGGLLKDKTDQYKIDPTHDTNINNMDPNLLEGNEPAKKAAESESTIGNEQDYTVEPTYALVNDEATKKAIAEVEKELYRTSTFDRAGRQELLAKHAELTAQLNLSANNAIVAKTAGIKKALEFRNPQVPSFKEVYRSGTIAKSVYFGPIIQEKIADLWHHGLWAEQIAAKLKLHPDDVLDWIDDNLSGEES